MTVLIVAQQEKRITVIARNESTWETRDYRAGDRFSLSVPAVELAVDEIYSVFGRPLERVLYRPLTCYSR